MPRNSGVITPPFAGAPVVNVVLPSQANDGTAGSQELELLRKLILREKFEFEVELGGPVQFSSDVSDACPNLLIGPAACNPSFARLELEPASEATAYRDDRRQLTVADGHDLSAVAESLSLLRTLTMSGQPCVIAADCKTIAEAINRLREEVVHTYPGFDLRGLDWDEICHRHHRHVVDASDTYAAMQRWIAELEDMHTWVQPTPPAGLLPYVVHVTSGQAVFVRVPDWSAAWAAGVRSGDMLADVDTTEILSRIGGPAHMRPYLAGRRFLSGPAGVPKSLSVIRSDGKLLDFTDTPSFTPWPEPAEWNRLESGSGYLKLSGFPSGINNVIDAALNDLQECDRLIVDLRGNSGGLLVEALDFRDRFVPEPMQMGWIRYSCPSGRLSRYESITAEPTTEYARWDKPVRFLADPLTASASEDALLGLNNLPDVKFVGTSTAGGSGRPRSIRLLPGMRLSVSTALTYETTGHCVESSGIEPDIPVPEPLSVSDFEGLAVADRSW